LSTQLRFPRPYLAEGEVEIPSTAYEAEYRQKVRELRRELVLPGFRPGQVPVEVIMTRHGEALLSEIVTRLFLEALDKGLEGRKLIGYPFYSRTPDSLKVQPPFPTYRYQVKALVVPSEPLPVEAPKLIRYQYKPDASDIPLYQRHLRTAFGALEPVEKLPETLPPDQEIIVRLQWVPPASTEPIRLSWSTLLQPFPWAHLAGRKVGESFTLPAQALSPYTEHIRQYLPTFSPLTIAEASVTLASAAIARPLPLEELKAQLDFSSFEGMEEEDIWKSLLERHTTRILQTMNLRFHQVQFLSAAGVQVPEELVQYNYLIYLQRHSKANGHLRSYEEYRLDLAWQVFFASYAYHEPELAISDEEVQQEVWERLREAPDLSAETQALIHHLEGAEEERQQFLRSFIGEQGENLRRSLQIGRFDAWLEKRFGPVQEQPLSANVLFLKLL
jgi:hypothetical protein